MGKKMIIIISVIVLLFVALIFVVNYKNDQATQDSPYGDKDLEQETIDQLDDPLYQNQIMPDDLSQQIEDGESVTVYFYSPVCVYCQNTTPYLVPLAEDMDVDMKKLNLYEFDAAWGTFSVDSTPTLVHYEDGEEVARLIGQKPEEEYQAFFEEYVN
ncbi:thioredoxin family protein [Oceanobacillus iheyensis]|uniref:Hypothetical conserved protein n=1 Tax=Oceanobacillus iheyensis (strain DSM 14371 / CIP 107618 / JCM 11309 / KCTC 3954 / HTE831) TaxID=221109 RepID=Q8ERY2_OCEIH|nr:thioredoxin family protein [Oceanobacillus iheyensis]BAC13120.1 hypothetical conserved protein [Oceanobacillus iheyensis HTE831]